MEKCPTTYPYPFDGGNKCCRSAMKTDNTLLSPDCDGNIIKYDSDKDCCFNQMYVGCNDQVIGCNYAKG